MKVRNKDLCFFLLPGILLYTLFTIIPAGSLFVLSFTKWNLLSFADIRFVGLANFTRMIHDDLVWLSLKHNVLFCVLGVTSQVLLGLFIAILLDKKVKGHSSYKVIFFLPVVLSMIVVGQLWSLLYDPYVGINVIFRLMGLKFLDRNWLGGPAAFYPIILVGIWKGFGFSMVLFLAGLQGIPPELVESAKIDGATEFQCYARVIIPLLKPVVVITVLLGFINSFRVFDLVYAMIKEGLGAGYSCIVMVTYFYTLAFKLFQAGYASTVSLFLALIMLAVSYVYLRSTRHV